MKIPQLSTYRWSSSDAADRFDVENPATGKIITTVQGGGAAQVDAAVKAANAAFENSWRWTSGRERTTHLMKCAEVLEAHADELAALETLEVGKPLSQARNFDISMLIASFRFFGGLIDKLPSEFFDHGPIYTSVLHEPFGVVAGIIPFNWPPIHTGGKVAPALAMGNTVVLKPGEQAPLTIMRIVELLQSVLPPDVLHAVPGYGPVTGRALASHPLVRKITFTGSTLAGAAVMKSGADNITPVLLELGGKNAFVVFPDADLDRALADSVEGAFFNQGEACTASSRLLIHESIYDTFVERLAVGVRNLKVGDGMVASTHVGPMVTKAHQQKVLDYIATGEAEGAKIAARGELPTDPALAGGYYVAPVLFRDVTPSMRIAKEEIFGPVVMAIPFRDFDDAIRIANDSEYGLVAGVYTKDTETGFRAARRIDAGIVFINNYNRGILGTPFGGFKKSGQGREHWIHTLREFGREKSIRFPSGEGPIPQWNVAIDVFGKK